MDVQPPHLLAVAFGLFAMAAAATTAMPAAGRARTVAGTAFGIVMIGVFASLAVFCVTLLRDPAEIRRPAKITVEKIEVLPPEHPEVPSAEEE